MLQRSSGGSYPAITALELRNISIPIPNKDVQAEIVKDIKGFIEKAEQFKAEATAEFESAKMKIETLIIQ
jgi:restriction endonuclease S subunit